MPLDHLKLRDLRLRRGLSQAAAAAAAGLSNKSAWSRLERGDQPYPNLKTLESVARVLGVSARRLGQLLAD